MPNAGLKSPEPLSGAHDLSAFRNGRHPALDSWLRDLALVSEGLSARTYVICAADKPRRVIGYYCLSTAMEQRDILPAAKLRRAMPKDVPLLLIGRLAVDEKYQGAGLGALLLRDALKRCVTTAELVGARGIIVHAIDDDAAAFYRQYSFRDSRLHERTLFLSIETARAAFA